MCNKYKLVGFINLFDLVPDFVYPIYKCKGKYYFQHGENGLIQDFIMVKKSLLNKIKKTKMLPHITVSSESKMIYAFQTDKSTIVYGNALYVAGYINRQFVDNKALNTDEILMEIIDDFLEDTKEERRIQENESSANQIGIINVDGEKVNKLAYCFNEIKSNYLEYILATKKVFSSRLVLGQVFVIAILCIVIFMQYKTPDTLDYQLNTTDNSLSMSIVTPDPSSVLHSNISINGPYSTLLPMHTVLFTSVPERDPKPASISTPTPTHSMPTHVFTSTPTPTPTPMLTPSATPTPTPTPMPTPSATPTPTLTPSPSPMPTSILKATPRISAHSENGYAYKDGEWWIIDDNGELYSIVDRPLDWNEEKTNYDFRDSVITDKSELCKKYNGVVVNSLGLTDNRAGSNLRAAISISGSAYGASEHENSTIIKKLRGNETVYVHFGFYDSGGNKWYYVTCEDGQEGLILAKRLLLVYTDQ